MTTQQQDEAVLITQVGCDRETAAKYVGLTLTELNAAIQDDADFARRLHQAEASCELAHMRQIQTAAREEKNWRASVWCLERRLPEKYARRSAGAVGKRELMKFLQGIAQGIAGSVRHEDDRQRVLDSLHGLEASLQDQLLLEKASE